MSARERYDCKRCGWEWHGRGAGKPKRCPRCRSPYWDKERSATSEIVDVPNPKEFAIVSVGREPRRAGK